jgi:hypothetical protein
MGTINLDDPLAEEQISQMRRLRALDASNPNAYGGDNYEPFIGSRVDFNSFSTPRPEDNPNVYDRPYDGSTPRAEYANRSGVNDAARSGGRVPELTSSMSLPGVNTSCESPRQGRYGQVQITETEAGHQIILNDTLGSESVMIRHASGSGIEMRADGSILISGTQIHYNVRGNAQFVIEGNADFRADGNMNFDAGGGMNFNASGEIAMRSPGSLVQDIGGNLTTAVGGHSNQSVGGALTSTILGERNETNLGGMSMNTQGDMTLRADGDGGIFASGNMNMTAQGRAMMSSPSVSITGSRLEVVGATGTMGGEGIIAYSLNSIVGESLQAGRTVSAQSMVASRTVQTHSVLSEFVSAQTVEAELNVDTHTINGTRGNIDTIVGSRADMTSMHATTFHGDLEGVAKEADGSGAYPGPTSAAQEDGVDGIEAEAPVFPDQRRTFVPSHQIIQDRQRGLSNGVRRVRVDPGNYIRNYMDRTVATGGNPNVTVDRTNPLPASSGGGTVARPGSNGGQPVPRQMTAAPNPRIPAAPHTSQPSTSGRLIQDLETRDPDVARQAADFVNNSRSVTGIGAEVTWLPLEIGGVTYMVTADYLRKTDGTYWRATEDEAQQIANNFNAEIPSPDQIDAIWTAAGTLGSQCHAVTSEDLARHYGYSPALANNDANKARLIREHNEHPHISGQAQGSETLRAGHFKSIAKSGGTLGIYGWRTRSGSLIQSFFSGHGGDYYDYSHGCRLIKRIS